MTESLIDFNRAGCALVEIVFSPDVRSANDASSVIATLRDTLRYVGTCNGRMEEGSLRCDLNISIAPLERCDDDHDSDTNEDNPFQALLPPGTGHRVEVKNLNSMKQGKGSHSNCFTLVAINRSASLTRSIICSLCCCAI